MQPSKANLINSLTLIVMPIWAYLTAYLTYESSNTDAMPIWEYLTYSTLTITPLIPMFLGVILLFCTKGIKNQNKIIAHIAVMLTLLALIGLFKPLTSAISDSRVLSIFRVSIMLMTCIFSMITFIKSFIAARKNG
mgnify:CR=1 FL=1|tara:strand:+ start:1014 stop:1421 length:408 start_codon:yes stop_codon:yes gene_type:complete